MVLMKKIVVLLVFMFSLGLAFAQTDSTTVTTTTTATPAPPQEKPKKKPYTMNVPKDRLVLDLNATNWIHKHDNGMYTRWYSRGINLYVMYDLQIKKSRVSFAIGAGISWVNIYNNSRLTDSAGSGARFTPIANYRDTLKINKVTETWIDIPLELRIRTNRDKLDQVWKFNVGFKFGIKVDAYTKQVFKNPHENIRLKPYPDFELFRMGPTLRIGYSSFNITGFYGLLGVFKTGRGPQANEWSLGVSFNGL
jgi:hypothetical protein